MAAAPADFRPSAEARQKIKKGKAAPKIDLEQTEDILRSTIARRKKKSVIVGFALETTDGVSNATEKLKSKNLDLVVLNNATEAGAGFGVDTNRVTLINRNGERRSSSSCRRRISRTSCSTGSKRSCVDAKALLRRYLEQRRELGESELVLDTLKSGRSDAAARRRRAARARLLQGTGPVRRDRERRVRRGREDWRASLREAGVNVDRPASGHAPQSHRRDAEQAAAEPPVRNPNDMAFKKGSS